MSPSFVSITSASRTVALALLVMPSVSASQQTRVDSLAQIVVRAFQPPRDSLPWPDFNMRDAILIVPVMPDGPTLLAGDPRPPTEFAEIAGYPSVRARMGAPPDSLVGLQLARNWNGHSRRATVVGLAGMTDHWIETAVHEAFHSYQHRAGSTGAPMLQTPFGEDRLALAVLDGWALVAAVTASERDFRDRLRRALAVRMRRCELLPDGCRAIRSLEAFEGSAKYVASLTVLGREALVRRVLRDSGSVYNLNQPTFASLARFHAYGTGELWHILLARLSVPGWPEQVARRWTDPGAASPDEIIARVVGWSVQDAVTAEALLESQEGRAAVTHVRAELTEATARRMAAQTRRAPVTHRLITIDVPRDQQVQMSMGALAGRGRVVSVRMGDDYIIVQQRYNEQRYSAYADVRGKTIDVDGRSMALDQPGEATGRVVLDLPDVRTSLRRATVRVDAGGVAITYRP